MVDNHPRAEPDDADAADGQGDAADAQRDGSPHEMTAPAVTTMRALGKERPGRGVELMERPVPTPAQGEVLLRVEAASICGTDYHVYSWDDWAQENFEPPRVLGHEIAGTVVERGTGVTRVRAGDLVGVESHVIDGTCLQCRRGDTHLCRNLKVVGFDLDGGYAEYMVIPEENAIESNGLDPAVVALQEPMGNAVHAAFVEPLEGRSVLVTGCGPIGLCAVGIARAAGASRVFATDTEAYRLDLARRMGADVVLDATAPDTVDRILAETDGDGIEVLLEMSGAEPALTQGLRALTRGGRVSLLGIYPSPITVDVSDLVIQKGARLHGIFGRRIYDTWERTQALLRSGKLDVTPIITHRLPLSDFERGFELIASRHAGKVVFIP
ncbi:MAG: L-threonine 3-dehydrogenase [Chloroflexota bacterium]|nr:L-threonine 3-dehydrogenase [Chloroflexota bacterium]